MELSGKLLRLSINGMGFFTQAGSLGVKLEARNTCNCRYTNNLPA